MATRGRFEGWVAGFGTPTGHRFVVDRWFRSPIGSFADVRWQTPEGRRFLVAPSQAAADLLGNIRSYDEVRVAPVVGSAMGHDLVVSAGPVRLSFTVGERDMVGWLLTSVPRWLRRSPATDHLPIVDGRAWLAGTDLGGLAEVDPPVDLGLTTVPRGPALVRCIADLDIGSPT